jgi:uncharacterized surface protein with fasciclin (FAS1) repeats
MIHQYDKEPVMNRLFCATLSTAAVMLAATGSARAADIVETASTSATFKTFVTAVKAAGLSDTLKNNGPYTVFAPSDSAFGKLPAGTVNSLLKDKTKLTQLLEHHVVPGKMTVAEVKPGQVTSLDGSTLKLTSDNGKVTVENANITQSDMMADNGVIHEIDTVVLPK